MMLTEAHNRGQVRHKKTGIEYALKMVDKHLIVRHRMVAHIKTERNILDGCDFPGIARLYFTFQVLYRSGQCGTCGCDCLDCELSFYATCSNCKVTYYVTARSATVCKHLTRVVLCRTRPACTWVWSCVPMVRFGNAVPCCPETSPGLLKCHGDILQPLRQQQQQQQLLCAGSGIEFIQAIQALC